MGWDIIDLINLVGFSSHRQYFGTIGCSRFFLSYAVGTLSVMNSCVHACICVRIFMQSTCSSVNELWQLFNLTPPIMLCQTHTAVTFSPGPQRTEKATRHSFNASEPLMCISFILCEVAEKPFWMIYEG